MKYIQNYKQTIDTSNLSQEDKNKILSALDFAISAHSGQTRKSGEEYIMHPVAVSQRLWELYRDIDLAIAGLLHDVVEDCHNISIGDIYAQFGEDIGFLCDSTNKQEKGFYANSEVFKDKLERLLWAGMKDVRVLILKIADREHNLDTIKHLKENKQVRMSFETQAIYEPLTQILNYGLKSTIQDTQNKLKQFILNNTIESSINMKEYLFSQSFQKVDNDLFGLYYKNTDSIIWEVDNYDTYVNLTNIPALCEKLNILSVKRGLNFFSLQFKLKTGIIFDDIRLSPASYKTN